MKEKKLQVKRIQTIEYQTSDYQIFKSEEEALAHEAEIPIKSFIKYLITENYNLQRNPYSHPDNSDFRNDREILHKYLTEFPDKIKEFLETGEW